MEAKEEELIRSLIDTDPSCAAATKNTNSSSTALNSSANRPT